MTELRPRGGLWSAAVARDELPLIATWRQRELENTMSSRDAGLEGVQARSPEGRVEFAAAGADDEGPDAASKIELPGIVERQELLVAVFVAVEHDVHAGQVEDLPQRRR